DVARPDGPRSTPSSAADSRPLPPSTRPIAESRRVRPAPFVAAGADLRPESSAAPESRGDAVVRGRCVDAATKAPLAGCAAELHGWNANSERMDEFTLRHGEVVWTDPELQTTQEDGRFEFRFSPPPPYQFAVDLSAEGRAGMGARWSALEPGSVTDVGDV